MVDYKYTGKVNNCKIKDSTDTDGAVYVNEYHLVKSKDPKQLKAALALGPVGIYLDASSSEFVHYSEGIISTETCGNSRGHAVLAVGYDTDPQTKEDYIIIKNTWGKNWGEDGYARISLS